MKYKFVEVSDTANWAKLMVGQWEASDVARKSVIATDVGLLEAVETNRRAPIDPYEWRLVYDLQTNEGAAFRPRPGHTPHDELASHRIWVCPLFLAFLEWLYEHNPADVAELPDIVNLAMSDTVKYQGFRRPGMDMKDVMTLRDKLIKAIQTTDELPDTQTAVAYFMRSALTEPERLILSYFKDSMEHQDWQRWIGALLMDSGAYVAAPMGDGKLGIVAGR